MELKISLEEGEKKTRKLQKSKPENLEQSPWSKERTDKKFKLRDASAVNTARNLLPSIPLTISLLYYYQNRGI